MIVSIVILRNCSKSLRRISHGVGKATTVIKQVLGESNEVDYQLSSQTGLNTPIQRCDRAKPIDGVFDPQQMIKYIFPKNYPHSVHDGYSTYVKFQMLSALLSSAGGVLSMQALLSAIGIGSGSLPLAATLNWVLKDGLGQLGGILFASVVNNRFDSEPKRWRLLAATSLELSCFIEMMTPLFPQYFLPIASFANIGKNISFLASSASRAAIHVSFAKSHNLADITAKAGSQNILSSMFGTGLGIGLSYCIGEVLGGGLGYSLVAFSTLSSTSLLAQYWSLKKVTLNSLNLVRLEHVLCHYLKGVLNHSDRHSQQTVDINELLTPATLRSQEKYLATQEYDKTLPTLSVGDDLPQAFTDAEEFQVMSG